jgi:DNA polymerase-3 subunit gamma/tau
VALALYRKYRPATFAEVVGQEHVTQPLRNALRSGRINHAYLFSGPRGCGKTSSARILARSLNCVAGPTDEPCGECESCSGLAPNGPGTVDVIELDAASHGGVDEARELRDRAFFAPAVARYRVFVIDEAHMVTNQGFNALLKIVEEPPEHLVFVFATTEPDKVISTIRSRTHHYPFRLIPPMQMRELLIRNCEAEGVTVEPAVLPLVIRAGGGSARDTQSVLDQLLAGAGSEGVTYSRAAALLGVTDVALIDELVDGLVADDGAAVFGTVERLVDAGHDPRRFAGDLLDRLRDLVLLRAVPDAGSRGLVTVPDDELERMTTQAGQLGSGTLARYAEIVHTGLTEMRGATAPRLLLELLCARMLLPSVSDQESDVLQRLERLERRMTAAGEVEHSVSPEPERPAPAPRAAPPEPEQTAPAEPAAEQAPPLEEVPAHNAPGAEATTAAMDAAGVRSVWSEVLAAVRGRSRSLEVMLSQATVRSVDGRVITLTHQTAPLLRRLSDPANTEVVAAALQSALGGEWQVRWERGDPEAGPETAQPAPVPPPPKPEPELEAAGEPEPEPEAAEDEEPDPGGPDRTTEDTAIGLLAQQLGASKIDG